MDSVPTAHIIEISDSVSELPAPEVSQAIVKKSEAAFLFCRPSAERSSKQKLEGFFESRDRIQSFYLPQNGGRTISTKHSIS